MNTCLFGDCRDSMRNLIADGVRVQMCVTSPPYWGLRDYGHHGQLGLEPSPSEYVANMVEVFRLVRDMLADDGVLWLNLGDSYASSTKGSGGGWAADPSNYANKAQAYGVRKFAHGLKPKDLIGIPWRVAFALQEDGWYLRQDIIWHKPNPMPESVADRCTKAHEYLFLLAKSERYYYDAEAIQEQAKDWSSGGPGTGIENTADRYGAGNGGNGGLSVLAQKYKDNVQPMMRNRRSVWTVATAPYSGAHFATFPPALIEPCILAGSRPGDIVLDPFFGSGTTGHVAQALGRRWIGCELNQNYEPLQQDRTRQAGLVF